MRRILSTALILLMVLGITACGNNNISNDNTVVTDSETQIEGKSDFISNLKNALIERWDIYLSLEDSINEMSKEDKKDIYEKLITSEQNELGAFDSYEFTDSTLETLAQKYYEGLEMQLSSLDYIDDDYSEFSRIRQEGEYYCCDCLKELHENFNFDMDGDYEAVFMEIIENSMPLRERIVENLSSDDYTVIENTVLSIKTPWTGEMNENSEIPSTILKCIQPTGEDERGAFIRIDIVEGNSLDSYLEKDQATEINSEKLGRVIYYETKTDDEGNEDTKEKYYTGYKYCFLDGNREIVVLTVGMPIVWEKSHVDFVNDIFKSLELNGDVIEYESDEDDFFASHDRNVAFNEFKAKGDYQGLYDYLSDYVQSEGAKEGNSAYTCIEVLNQIIPLMSMINAEYDEMNNLTYFTYVGAEDISPSVHIYPYCTSQISATNTLSINVRAGFREADWLFFDKIQISGTNKTFEKTKIKSYDKTQEVMDGGIYEAYDFTLSVDNISEICDYAEAKIRFTNTDENEFLEYGLSDEEKSALKTICELSELLQQLSLPQAEYNVSHM